MSLVSQLIFAMADGWWLKKTVVFFPDRWNLDLIIFKMKPETMGQGHIDDILQQSFFRIKEQKKLLASLFLKVDLPLLFVSDSEWPIFGRMKDG